MRKLLLVDDDSSVAEIFRSLCVDMQVQVTHAIDANEALSLLPLVKPDVLFLDLRLPGLVDGWKLAKILKFSPEYHSLPIIIISASDCDLMQIHTAQCHGYIRKPFSIYTVRETIHRVLSSDTTVQVTYP